MGFGNTGDTDTQGRKAGGGGRAVWGREGGRGREEKEGGEGRMRKGRWEVEGWDVVIEYGKHTFNIILNYF